MSYKNQNKQSRRFFALRLVILTLLINLGCKSRLKSTTLPKAFEDLHVELINFLPEDAQLFNLKISLFDCSWQNETIEGKIESSSAASFKLSGVGANGGRCSLKISSPAENLTTLKFIAEAGRLYEANRVVLERNASQKLVATAILSRSYNRIPSGTPGDSLGAKKPGETILIESTLTATTKLPANDTIKTTSEYLAQLQCNPTINFVSVGEKQNTGTLNFKFKTFLLQGTKWKYDCHKLVVFQDSEFSYYADLTKPTLVSLQGTAGDTISLLNGATIDLKPVSRNITPSTVSDVFLRVQIGDCSEKEKLDPKNKNCYVEPIKD